jgi:hypothetical protein
MVDDLAGARDDAAGRGIASGDDGSCLGFRVIGSRSGVRARRRSFLGLGVQGFVEVGKGGEV